MTDQRRKEHLATAPMAKIRPLLSGPENRKYTQTAEYTHQHIMYFVSLSQQFLPQNLRARYLRSTSRACWTNVINNPPNFNSTNNFYPNLNSTSILTRLAHRTCLFGWISVLKYLSWYNKKDHMIADHVKLRLKGWTQRLVTQRLFRTSSSSVWVRLNGF